VGGHGILCPPRLKKGGTRPRVPHQITPMVSSHDFVTADKFINYGWPLYGPCIRIWLFSRLDLSSRQKVDLATLLQALQVTLLVQKGVGTISHEKKAWKRRLHHTTPLKANESHCREKLCLIFFRQLARSAWEHSAVFQ